MAVADRTFDIANSQMGQERTLEVAAVFTVIGAVPRMVIATNEIEATIDDYSKPLGCHPCVVVSHEHAFMVYNIRQLINPARSVMSARRTSLC
ncbi:MAG: hypothetical protein KC588_13995 [Nitrospira sp.]|nr:hypothetical protein [Nitrospira sp.]